MADATNPAVLSSFTGRLKAFQNELGKQGVNSVTELENLYIEDAKRIYLDLVRSGNQHLADLIGNTPDSDFVQGNAAVVNPESLSMDETLLREAAQRWGIDIDPDMPQIWRDKKAGVNKRINGDVKNFDKTSLMELAASMFFENEEQRTQLATSGVTHQYQAQLDAAVPASSPQFVNWFRETMDVWTNLPAGYRSQFLADLQRTDEQAWADLIHECIYEPGKRPSDTTEIIPEKEKEDSEGKEEEGDSRGEDGEQRQEWPDGGPPGGGGLPGTWPEFPEQEWPDGGPPSVRTPRVIDKREQQAHGAHRRPGRAYWNPDALIAGVVDPPEIGSPGGERPPPEYGKWRPHRPVIQPETVTNSPSRNSSFGQNFEHPLDPEAWDRHGLGFLRTLTPGFIEDWLMENYNKEASAERRAEEYGVS